MSKIDKEREARKIAMSAARLMLEEKLSQLDAVKKYGSTRSSLSYAGIILANGTPEEIAAATAGDVSLVGIVEAIRARLPKEQRIAKAVVRGPADVDKRQFEADLWAQLRDSMDGIRGLPSPSDMAAVVRKNINRIDHVNRDLMAVLAWIEEFSDAWTR